MDPDYIGYFEALKTCIVVEKKEITELVFFYVHQWRFLCNARKIFKVILSQDEGSMSVQVCLVIKQV